LKIELAWRRASLSVVTRRADEAPPKTVRGWQMPKSDAREEPLVSEVPLAPGDLDDDSVARAS
jgi:hypothetical protein